MGAPWLGGIIALATLCSPLCCLIWLFPLRNLALSAPYSMASVRCHILAVSRTGSIVSRRDIAAAGAACFVTSSPHRRPMAPLARWRVMRCGSRLWQQRCQGSEHLGRGEMFGRRRHASFSFTGSKKEPIDPRTQRLTLTLSQREKGQRSLGTVLSVTVIPLFNSRTKSAGTVPPAHPLSMPGRHYPVLTLS